MQTQHAKQKKWSQAFLVGGLVVIGLFLYQTLMPTVIIKDNLEGQGLPAKGGLTVTFDYRAYLYDEKHPLHLGTLIESTYDRQQPRTLVLGEHQIIKGVEKALYGMKVGGLRQVTIPPELAYGEGGAGDGLVPPHATMVYQIEMRRIEASK